MESEVEKERDRQAGRKDCQFHVDRDRVCVPVPSTGKPIMALDKHLLNE